MIQKRFRMRYQFWLDLTKNGELWLADEIENLKNQRLFAQTIRDGIRLIADLRAGRTGVLFELFPWLAAELSTPQPDQALKDEIAQLRALIMAQGATGAAPAGLTAKMHPVIPPDDIDTPLTVTASASTGSAKNFLSSIMALQQ